MAARRMTPSVPRMITVVAGSVGIGLASTALYRGESALGLQASEAALGIADGLGNAGLRINAATMHGWHVFASGRVAEGIAEIESAWQESDRLSLPVAGFVVSSTCASSL